MLKIIRQFFSARQNTPSPARVVLTPKEAPGTTLVYVRVKPETKSVGGTQIETVQCQLPISAGLFSSDVASAEPIASDVKMFRQKPRKALAGKSLSELAIFSARQINLLRQIGCHTDRQLMRLTPRRLEKRLTRFASAQQNNPKAPVSLPIDRIRSLVKRGRWAIRFANHFEDMTPRESLLLRSVHRGTRQTLSRDTAGLIRRDLQRLSLSSRGKRLVTLDQIPDLQRIKNWISLARKDQKPVTTDSLNRQALSALANTEDLQTDVPMVPR